MGKDHETEGPSLRPLLVVLGLFLSALAGALGTAGPASNPRPQTVKVAPAGHHLPRRALLTSELGQLR